MSELEPAVDEPRGFAARLVATLHRRALLFMALAVLIAIGVGLGARKLHVDNSLRVWFVEGDPALTAYDHYKESFGSDETIIVAVTDPQGVYRPATLERIRAASKRLEDHDKVRRVTSIALGLHVSGDDGFVQVEKLLGDGKVTPEEAEKVARRVAANPTFSGTIAADNDKVTLILVDPKASPRFERERAGIIKDIEKIAHEELQGPGSDLGVHFGGIGVVYEGLNEATLRDTSIFMTLSYLVIFAGLWLLFRRWTWVLLGAGVVTLANAATLGLAGLAGRDMNMVTAVLPTLIMTIGILDLIHIIDAYEDGAARDPGAPKRRLLIGSLSVVVVPCIFNSVTDIFGFAALTSARMSAVRDLGWLAAAGLGFLLCCVLIFAIPALARFGRPAKQTSDEATGWMRHLVMGLFRIARDRRPLVYGVTAALMAVSVWGITRIDVDTYTIGFLPKDNPVRRDHHAIEEAFGPYIPLEVTVTAPPPKVANDPLYAGVKDPVLLGRIDAMERRFEALPEIARATGLPEVVKRINQIWNAETPESYAVPDKEGVIAEELLNYGFEADGRDHLEDLVTPDWRVTHVSTRTGLPTARGIAATVRDLQREGQKVVGDAGTVEPAGYLPLYVRIIQHITDTQVRSFGIAFLLVTLVMIILLRSVKLGLVAMIPNLVPAAATLGFMGLTGIRLDVATVLIAAIAIGISVNDTTHIMFRYRHEVGQTPDDPVGAVRRMMLHTGRAVVASSVLLIAGFGVLMFAQVKSVSLFGLLSAATILSALIADLLITPALLLTLAPPARD